ncbi:unnamed protein product [Owenia fusiformis]|uniref:Peptidase M14 domain-containing protein n=1 Tax=Owenia fusiformis TaxID=6347 RepID=A0A8J1TUW2_OWEFU|nr:unnamed protein product [Owenia fusiformis]
MGLLCHILILAIGFTLVASAPEKPPVKKSYRGHKIYKALPGTRDQAELINRLEVLEHLGVDVWRRPKTPGQEVTLSVSPRARGNVERFFKQHAIPYSIVIHDLQSMIDSSYESTEATSYAFSLTQYNRHDDINDWLDSTASSCGSRCSIENIGTSTNGRTLKVIKIGKSSSSNSKAIWVDAGIHAREWISPAASLYLIDKLVNSYNSDSTVRSLVDAFDWYILPSSNPDGYEYSYVYDRLWRKTRSRNSGSSCFGADPNRNWDYKWMLTGASSNPCSDTYAGSIAFSEPETTAMKDFMLSKSSSLNMYISIHAYGQYILTPWGYTEDLPSDYNDLEYVGNEGAAGIRGVNGRSFTVGSSTRVLYAAAGASDDWAKAVAGIKYSYTLELRDTGYWGFVLPVSQITPACEETYAGIVRMAQAIM